MAYYGSNYPPTYASSGPPPPPGGGFGGYNPYGGGGGGYNPYGGGSAYNVNQYGMGAQAPPSAYGGGYQQQAAVPGFTAPPPMQMPQSRQYSQAQQAFQPYGVQAQMIQEMAYQQQNNPELEELRRMKRELEESHSRRRRRNEDDDGDDEEKEKLKEMLEKERKLLAEAQAKIANDGDMKIKMKEKFISELMRRQAVNGTFEDTSGVVFPLVKYESDDPVTKWFTENKSTDITDEKWDPLYDAEYLRFGIKGLGTNEQVIINVVASRCNAQRNRILKEYKTAYGRDLMKDLRGELSGDFKESILACFETPSRYDAWCVKKAIYGAGTNESTLIEILLTRTNAQIEEMKKQYNQITYEKQRDPDMSIEKDIEGDCSGDFKRLLISACQANRRPVEQERLEEAVVEVQNQEGQWTGMFQIDYTKLCNMKKCKRMADELFKAGEDKWGTDEETFNRIFATQDFYTLRCVYDEYVKITQRDIVNSVDRETSGDLKKGLLTVAQVVKCRPMAFADRLYKSMKGLGTDDSTLIRICISRSEIDMQQIKACFLEKYKQTVWNFINDDTSGDYRKLLLAIVGRN